MSSLLNTVIKALIYNANGCVWLATLYTVSISFASTDSCWYCLLNAIITRIKEFAFKINAKY